MIWLVVKIYCVSLGFLLVIIYLCEENDFVCIFIFDQVWFGVNDIVLDGIWVWEDGVEWGGFILWFLGEFNGGDNEQCLYMIYDLIGEWNDDFCSN